MRTTLLANALGKYEALLALTGTLCSGKRSAPAFAVLTSEATLMLAQPEFGSNQRVRVGSGRAAAAVASGDDFQKMAAGIVEIASTAIFPRVDFAMLATAWIPPEIQTAPANAIDVAR